MNSAELRERLKAEIQARRAKRIAKLGHLQNYVAVESQELAGQFADDTSEVVVDQLDNIASELPQAKRHQSSMDMLRETKRALMIEEQSRQALVRANEKNQTGASLKIGRAMDTFGNWMDDGFDRAYAHRVVSDAMKK